MCYVSLERFDVINGSRHYLLVPEVAERKDLYARIACFCTEEECFAYAFCFMLGSRDVYIDA